MSDHIYQGMETKSENFSLPVSRTVSTSLDRDPSREAECYAMEDSLSVERELAQKNTESNYDSIWTSPCLCHTMYFKGHPRSTGR